MAQTRRNPHRTITFNRLMRWGRTSYSQGNYNQAHDFWQQAAMMRPDNEEVWIALLSVLENVDDRRVCLRNILTINPDNQSAQEMLDKLVGDTQPEDRIVPDIDPHAPRRIFALGGFVLRLLESVVIGALIATAVLLVRYLLF
jgi:hypothetical protein